MGKGFNSAKNKQAALQEKLEQAKKQKGRGEENDCQAHDEIQRQESSDPQHDEFARLLAQSQPVRSERVFTQSESRTQQPQAATSHKPKVNAKVLKKRKKMTAASKKQGEVLLVCRRMVGFLLLVRTRLTFTHVSLAWQTLFQKKRTPPQRSSTKGIAHDDATLKPSFHSAHPSRWGRCRRPSSFRGCHLS